MKSPPANDAYWEADIDDALRIFASERTGIEAAEADRRREVHGLNRLAEKPPPSAWALVFAQLRGFLNLILIGAAVLAGTVGDVKDAVIISAVILFNTALGFIQEYRAERTMAALKAMVAFRARALRGGRPQDILADQLVPGDVVLLEGGDRVPADGRLIEAHSLEIDESALTGESVPVAKSESARLPATAAIAERRNCAFMNTVVTRGRGTLLVTATGPATQMGQVAGMLAETVQPPTPLQRQLDHLGKTLAAIAVVVVAVVSTFEFLRGDTFVDIAFEAIALFVAAIPEGLPAVLTVTLALGLQRMARQKAIVKRLAAVETLGCTTVICTDKTGTLTMNQMTARAIWYRGATFSVSGEGYRAEGAIAPADHPGGPASTAEFEPLATALALCNDSRVHEGELVGDPTEGALLVLSQKAGLEPEEIRQRLPRLAEVPFESERKFMATLHRAGEAVRVFVKGAPDAVLGRCEKVLGAHGEEALSDQLRSAVARQNEMLASRGLRVLAVATRTLEPARQEALDDPLAETGSLTLIGLVGLVDPLRPEAKQAVEQCRIAGIAVKMITGDHRATAGAIAAELGLSGEVVDGAELDSMDDAGLVARVENIAVFARVAPEHKLRIVRALKAKGHVVAMTGDGVNDAPALKSADIGVGMGSGTEVAKEAATMVLTDDNFASIVRAVREGRTIYDNIVKFVRFQLSTNMGAILTVFVAPLLGQYTPLKPIHILFVAMLVDGPPAVALGVDPSRPAIMHEPPRSPGARILTPARLGTLVFYGAIMAAGTLGLMHVGGLDPDHAATLAFTTFVFFQLFNLLNVRSEGRSVLSRHTFTNSGLWLAIAAGVVLQVAVVHWAPLRSFFDTVPLSLPEWALAVAVGSSLVMADELRKALVRGSAKRPRR